MYCQDITDKTHHFTRYAGVNDASPPTIIPTSIQQNVIKSLQTLTPIISSQHIVE